jgi:hypothetical protein
MPDFDLKAKVGPLPVWGWGVLVAVLALVAYYLYSRNRGAAGGDTGVVPTTSIDASGYHTSGLSGSGTASLPTTTAETNTGWIARLTRQVADILGASPSDVQRALTKYVNGESYTTAEKAYIDKAIAIGMAPPEGVYNVGEQIPDAPAPTRPVLDTKVGKVVAYFKAPDDATIWQILDTGIKRGVVGWESFLKMNPDGAYTTVSPATLRQFQTGSNVRG